MFTGHAEVLLPGLVTGIRENGEKSEPEVYTIQDGEHLFQNLKDN